MAKILFDIAAPGSTGLTGGHLLMEISPHLFGYVVTGGNKKLSQLRFYKLEARDNHELAEEIAGIISKDSILKEPPPVRTLVYNFPESQLVPAGFFSSSINAGMNALLHGDLNKGIILSERIQGSDQYNVYQVPAELHSLLQRSFNNSKYWHYYTLWMAAEQQQTEQPASFLSVLFYPNRILVNAVKNQQLHLLQSFVYEAAEDAAYYLLNTCLQLNLPPETTPLVLSGMIDGSSALYTEVYKYFGRVSLDAFPGASIVAAPEEYPAHFFSPLLKLALCV